MIIDRRHIAIEKLLVRAGIKVTAKRVPLDSEPDLLAKYHGTDCVRWNFTMTRPGSQADFQVSLVLSKLWEEGPPALGELFIWLLEDSLVLAKNDSPAKLTQELLLDPSQVDIASFYAYLVEQDRRLREFLGEELFQRAMTIAAS